MWRSGLLAGLGCTLVIGLLALSGPVAAQGDPFIPTITVPPTNTPTRTPTVPGPTATWFPYTIPTARNKDFRTLPTAWAITPDATIARAFGVGRQGFDSFADTIINSYRAVNLPVVAIPNVFTIGLSDIIGFFALLILVVSLSLRVMKLLKEFE